MRNKRHANLAVYGLGLFMLIALAQVPTARAQNLQRFAANALNFGDTNEVDAIAADTTTNPVPFYSNVVTTSKNINVLFVTISATGDTHSGASSLVQCVVDGIPCTTGNVGSDSSPGAGWVTVQKHAVSEDLHDNTVTYTWCALVEKNKTHSVNLNFASDGKGEVFLEQVNVFVDGQKFKDATQACTSKGTGKSGPV